MTSEDGHHLRDEAGSLLAAFELGGAEELTVASGGTAMAALVCRQSHMSSQTTFSSRACSLVAARCWWQKFKVVLHAQAVTAVEFTRLFATPQRASSPPSTATQATTHQHQLTPNTHIIPTTYTLNTTLYTEQQQHEIEPSWRIAANHSSESLASSRFPSAFVLCPLSYGFHAAGSVDSSGS